MRTWRLLSPFLAEEGSNFGAFLELNREKIIYVVITMG